MAETYTAVNGFAYPADAESLRIVREAGGFSQLSDEQKAAVRYKRVSPGEDCSDMPVESLAMYLERGEVVRVALAPKRAKKAEVEE